MKCINPALDTRIATLAERRTWYHTVHWLTTERNKNRHFYREVSSPSHSYFRPFCFSAIWTILGQKCHSISNTQTTSVRVTHLFTIPYHFKSTKLLWFDIVKKFWQCRCHLVVREQNHSEQKKHKKRNNQIYQSNPWRPKQSWRLQKASSAALKGRPPFWNQQWRKAESQQCVSSQLQHSCSDTIKLS